MRVELLSKGSESERSLVVSELLLLFGCVIGKLDELVNFDSIEGQGLLELLDPVL